MILVVGANGFIGRNLMQYFIKNNIPVEGISRSNEGPFKNLISEMDLCYDRHTSLFFKPRKFYAIVYCATSQNNSDSSIDVVLKNCNMLRNVLEWARSSFKNLIYLSSADVYNKYSLSQGAATYDELDPKSYYGFSKMSEEWMVRKALRDELLDYLTIIRPCAMCGIYATHGLIKVICDKLISSSKELNLIGPAPGTIKPFLCVQTLVKYVGELIHSIPYNTNEANIVNLAGKKSISVERVVDIVMEKMGVYKDIVWSGKTWADDNKIVKLNTQIASTSEEEIRLGVEDYVNSL